MSKPKINLMFDSGAFSAFTQKKPIDIQAYAQFLNANIQHILLPVNLDSINPESPAKAAEKSWENFTYLADSGVITMPVFHAREPVIWLEKMIENCPYIGLSGTSLVSPSEHMRWYDTMWRYVTDINGYPVSNFHAFGDTSPISLRKYPWRSADSASWQIQSGKTGSIIIDGKAFKLRSKTVMDSKYIESNDTQYEAKKARWEQEFKRRKINSDLFFKEQLGPVELTAIRCYLNASYLLDLQESTRPVTKFPTTNRLIGDKKFGPGTEREGSVNLYFVVSTAVCGWALPVLTKLGIKNILISYYYCEKKFWEREFIPFLYDPEGQCQSNPRFKKYWDLLEKFSLKEEVA